MRYLTYRYGENRMRPRWGLSQVRTDPMNRAKNQSEKDASQDVKMAGQRRSVPSLDCLSVEARSQEVRVAPSGLDFTDTVRRSLLNCSGDANLGAHHLSPLGAGFFMRADPSRRASLEAQR